MNRIILILLLISSLSCFSQTQSEMNKTALSEYQQSNNILNKIYQDILSQYKQNKIFIRNLKASQRHWIKYRDAELKLTYPEQASEIYGSSFSMCRTILLTKLTEERSESLNKFLTKKIDGDICN